MLRVVSVVSVVFKKMSTLRFVAFVKTFVAFVVKLLYEGEIRVNPLNPCHPCCN